MAGAKAADGPMVEAVARVMVSVTAPEELILVRLLSESPGRGKDRERDSPLGFGGTDLAVLVAPVAVAVATQVVQYLLQAVGAPVVARLVRRLSGAAEGDGEPPGDEPTLTAEQWRRVWQIIVDKAVAEGLEEARAREMADAVVGRGQLGSQ